MDNIAVIYMRDHGQYRSGCPCSIVDNIVVVMHARSKTTSQMLHMPDHGQYRSGYTCEISNNIAALIHETS